MIMSDDNVATRVLDIVDIVNDRKITCFSKLFDPDSSELRREDMTNSVEAGKARYWFSTDKPLNLQGKTTLASCTDQDREMGISGTLEVVLESAEGIKTRDTICCLGCLIPWIDATQPYVFVQHGSQEHISSVAEEEGKKHVWNEKFKFNVDYPGGQDHPEDKLIFRVMDKHKISEDEFVGEATIYIKEVLLEGMERGKFELQSRKYRVVAPDTTYTGQICVAITFTKVWFVTIVTLGFFSNSPAAIRSFDYRVGTR
ncbi:hypothetical protein RJ639_029309 [Escallonia herrerae]|uniref:C2 domain-containing protein n=1 Tax=Escallonia herrerae TaxID=1293975 RepID=A0AA88X4G8_9ASTE|nr:hypothetical protein RJ639_029309 [Escallonia herrerae]